MFSDRRFRKPVIAAMSVTVLILLLALGAEFALANKPAPPVIQGVAPESPTGYGDDGILEVGVEWINDFPGTADDRSHWDESCDGLNNHLIGEGWTSRFHFTDWNAWETDFKNESLGGNEDSYVDSVDIAMICTHGSGAYDHFWDKDLSSVYFGSSHTDQDLSPGDAYQGYGDKDLEWLAFDSCSVLSDGGAAPYYNRGYWAATMNGLHLLLGFKNTMYVWAPGDGDLWGTYMNGISIPFFGWILPPSSVMQSWFLAVDSVQPSVTCARVLANTNDNFNDYLHGKGYVSADPPTDGYYSYWDHCSTSGMKDQTASYINHPELLSVPRILVQDRLVDENYVLNRVAPPFNFTGDVYSDDMNFYMVNTSGGMTQTLQVDRVTGSFSYHNLSRLWVPPTVAPTLPNANEAYAFMENWFKNQGEGLPGVWYRDYANWTYDIEEMVDMYMNPGENGTFYEQEIANTPADGVMTYPRLIPAKAGTVDGLQQVDFPVFGPGGRLKIYFGGMEDIIGAQGGSRDVLVSAEQVNILDAPVVWQMFLEDHSLAIPEVPWVADMITYDTAILGYYEMPYMIPQGELIPVWQFMADFYSNGNLLAQDVAVYVPAASEFMPPQVEIVSPVDGALYLAGDLISFEGKVVSGGTPPYTYEWNSSNDGFLGSATTLVSALTSPLKDGTIFPNSISFTVVDANGLSGTATISVNVTSPFIWLALVGK
jgi:hypothetical protein